MADQKYLKNGSNTASTTLILAHGAGAPMDSEFLQTFATDIASTSVRCVRFEFPYMAERRVHGVSKPPNRLPILIESWKSIISKYRHSQLIIGGKSMGGRIASILLAENDYKLKNVLGLVCFGYPFHTIKTPGILRFEHFHDIKVPTLILQGERDPFGSKIEVSKYKLPQNVHIHWLKDGEHSFIPRKKSGRSKEQNWREGINRTKEFIKDVMD